MTESEIILGCQQGKAAYQKELVERYSPMLMTVCRRYTWDQESAKDILQESMIKIFKNIQKYKPIGSFEAWMRRICINTALQTLKKSYFKWERHGLDELTAQPYSMPDVYSHLGAEELMEIIEQLPQGYKQVFNLVIIDGFSHREVAEALNIKESTSRSQLKRARDYLIDTLIKIDKIIA